MLMTATLSPPEIVVTIRLTGRQSQVLQLLARGLLPKQIGLQLGISSRTVRAHIRDIRLQVGAETRDQMMALAVSFGLVEIPDD